MQPNTKTLLIKSQLREDDRLDSISVRITQIKKNVMEFSFENKKKINRFSKVNSQAKQSYQLVFFIPMDKIIVNELFNKGAYKVGINVSKTHYFVLGREGFSSNKKLTVNGNIKEKTSKKPTIPDIPCKFIDDGEYDPKKILISYMFVDNIRMGIYETYSEYFYNMKKLIDYCLKKTNHYINFSNKCDNLGIEPNVKEDDIIDIVNNDKLLLQFYKRYYSLKIIESNYYEKHIKNKLYCYKNKLYRYKDRNNCPEDKYLKEKEYVIYSKMRKNKNKANTILNKYIKFKIIAPYLKQNYNDYKFNEKKLFYEYYFSPEKIKYFTEQSSKEELYLYHIVLYTYKCFKLIRD